jgi:hypothetical protein
MPVRRQRAALRCAETLLFCCLDCAILRLNNTTKTQETSLTTTPIRQKQNKTNTTQPNPTQQSEGEGEGEGKDDAAAAAAGRPPPSRIISGLGRTTLHAFRQDAIAANNNVREIGEVGAFGLPLTTWGRLKAAARLCQRLLNTRATALELAAGAADVYASPLAADLRHQRQQLLKDGMADGPSRPASLAQGPALLEHRGLLQGLLGKQVVFDSSAPQLVFSVSVLDQRAEEGVRAYVRERSSGGGGNNSSSSRGPTISLPPAQYGGQRSPLDDAGTFRHHLGDATLVVSRVLAKLLCSGDYLRAPAVVDKEKLVLEELSRCPVIVMEPYALARRVPGALAAEGASVGDLYEAGLVLDQAAAIAAGGLGPALQRLVTLVWCHAAHHRALLLAHGDVKFAVQRTVVITFGALGGGKVCCCVFLFFVCFW